jgi:hypothetical protein
MTSRLAWHAEEAPVRDRKKRIRGVCTPLRGRHLRRTKFYETGFRAIAARKVSTALFVVVLFATTTAVSDEGEKEQYWITGATSFELQNDATVASENTENERNVLFATIEPLITVHFTPELSFTAHAVLEPVRDPDPGEDSYLDGHGLYLEELRLDYQSRQFSLIGGKFTPNFGKAWDLAPGIYGTDFAEDYELTERIGFGGGASFESRSMGEHTLSANLFFLDTSAMSDAVITSRPRNRRSDGGPSNTESPKSVAIASDGALPIGIDYHLAFVNQAKGEGDTADERGVAIALSREFRTDTVGLTPLAEYAHFWNADAVSGQSRNFLTLALGMTWQNWSTAVVYARRDSDLVGSPDKNDSLFQISAGYEFPFGLTLDLGWAAVVEDNVTSHTIGTLLAYNLDLAFLAKAD